MKLYLLIVLIIATLWDGFTTAYGTIQVLGNGAIQFLASLLFSALILAFVLNTRRIMSFRHDLIGVVATIFWFIALCFDFYTSWIGNKNLVIQGNSNPAATTLLIGLTLLVIASPILLSVMGHRFVSRREQETSPPQEVKPARLQV